MSWNLEELIQEVKDRGQYDIENSWEQNLLESYLLLGELLNPDNAYKYEVYQGEIYYFNDMMDNRFCARMVFQPTRNPYFEFKTWWVDPKSGKPVYHELPNNISAQDWDKRSDTIAKIFRDECLPKFEKQDKTNLLYLIPVDSKRYQFSLRMIKKFIPSKWKIIENFPKQIIIDKGSEE